MYSRSPVNIWYSNLMKVEILQPTNYNIIKKTYINMHIPKLTTTLIYINMLWTNQMNMLTSSDPNPNKRYMKAM